MSTHNPDFTGDDPKDIINTIAVDIENRTLKLSSIVKLYVHTLENSIANSGILLPATPSDWNINSIMTKNYHKLLPKSNSSFSPPNQSKRPRTKKVNSRRMHKQSSNKSIPKPQEKQQAAKKKPTTSFLAAGRYSGHTDGIWQLDNAKWPSSFLFSSGPASGPDSPYEIVASASVDKTVGIWAVQSAKMSPLWSPMIAQLQGHSGAIRSAKFHPNKPIVTACSGDGRILSWRLSSNLGDDFLHRTQDFDPVGLQPGIQTGVPSGSQSGVQAGNQPGPALQPGVDSSLHFGSEISFFNENSSVLNGDYQHLKPVHVDPFRRYTIGQSNPIRFPFPWFNHLSSFSSPQRAQNALSDSCFLGNGETLAAISSQGDTWILDLERAEPIHHIHVPFKHIRCFHSYIDRSYLEKFVIATSMPKDSSESPVENDSEVISPSNRALPLIAGSSSISSASESPVLFVCSNQSSVHLFDTRLDQIYGTHVSNVSSNHNIIDAKLWEGSAFPTLLTLSSDRFLRGFDLRNPSKPILSFVTAGIRSQSGYPTCLCFHPEIKSFIIIPFDTKTVKIFDLARSQEESRRLVSKLIVPTNDMLTSCVWIKNGDYPLISSFPGHMYFWNQYCED